MIFRTTLILIMLCLYQNDAHAASPWRGGQTPDWVMDCQYSEKSGVLSDLEDYNRCNSKGYDATGDILSYHMFLNNDGTYTVDPEIRSVHVLVTDIRLDKTLGLSKYCNSKMCYRALVFINGDSESGQHVATWITSPGVPWRDGTGVYTPESRRVLNKRKEPNQNDKGYFMLQQDHEMGLGGVMNGKIDGYYVLDHYVNSNKENMGWAACYHYGICFHASSKVNGNVASHGCTRMKYIESKKINFLARHALRNFTVETRYTERHKLSSAQLEEINSNFRKVNHKTSKPSNIRTSFDSRYPQPLLEQSI